jgi:hypothetical protein
MVGRSVGIPVGAVGAAVGATVGPPTMYMLAVKGVRVKLEMVPVLLLASTVCIKPALRNCGVLRPRRIRNPSPNSVVGNVQFLVYDAANTKPPAWNSLKLLDGD